MSDGGVESLLEQSRQVPNHKNRVDPMFDSAIIQYAIDEPTHGQVCVSNELHKKGIFISQWCAPDLATK